MTTQGTQFVGFSNVSLDKDGRRIKAQTDLFGMDYAKLADSIEEAEKARGKKHQDVLDQRTAQLSEWDVLQGHLRKVNASLRKMTARTKYDEAHAFSSVTATYTTSAASPQGIPEIKFATNLSNLKRQNFVQDFSFSVEQMATKDTGTDLTGGGALTSVASRTTALGLEGSITLALSDVDIGTAGPEYDIPLETDDTIDIIAEKINLSRETTKVSAQVIYNEDSSGYVLFLQADETGKALQIDKSAITSGDLDYFPDQNYDGTPGELVTLEDTLISKFTFQGKNFTRTNNDVDDLIEGMTITLKGDTNGQTHTVSIGPDVQGASETIEAYRDAHNQLAKYLEEKTAKDPDTYEPLEGAVFADNALVKSIQNDLKKITGILSQGSSISGSYQSASTVGIKMDKNNPGEIIFDSLGFQEAFKTNPDDVRRLFTFQSTFDNDDVMLLRAPNRWAVPEDDLWGATDYMDVTINRDIDDNYTATFSINGSTVNAKLTVLTNSIRIQSLGDTDFESNDTPTSDDQKFRYLLKGLSLSYNVDPTTLPVGDTSFRMTGSQGALDVYGRSIGTYFNTDEATEKGKIFSEKENLENQKKSKQDAVKKVEETAAKKRADFEEKMSRLQGVLSVLTTQLEAIKLLTSSFESKS